MIASQLADWLAGIEGDDTLDLTIGTNLFIGEFPEKIEDAIMLVSVPSDQPDKYTGVEYQTIDIWSRYKDHGAGDAKIQKIFKLLHRTAVLYLPDYHVYNIKALGRIDDLDSDANSRKLLKATFELTYRKLDLIS